MSKPDGYIFKHPMGRLFWSIVDESCKDHQDVVPFFFNQIEQECQHEWKNIHYDQMQSIDMCSKCKKCRIGQGNY